MFTSQHPITSHSPLPTIIPLSSHHNNDFNEYTKSTYICDYDDDMILDTSIDELNCSVSSVRTPSKSHHDYTGHHHHLSYTVPAMHRVSHSRKISNTDILSSELSIMRDTTNRLRLSAVDSEIKVKKLQSHNKILNDTIQQLKHEINQLRTTNQHNANNIDHPLINFNIIVSAGRFTPHDHNHQTNDSYIHTSHNNITVTQPKHSSTINNSTHSQYLATVANIINISMPRLSKRYSTIYTALTRSLTHTYTKQHIQNHIKSPTNNTHHHHTSSDSDAMHYAITHTVTALVALVSVIVLAYKYTKLT